MRSSYPCCRRLLLFSAAHAVSIGLSVLRLLSMIVVASHDVFVVCSRITPGCASGFLVVTPWLEWCPDPQQPDAQWVKIFHPGSWTPQDERDDPPPRHTYREWKEFYAPSLAHDEGQPTRRAWYKRDWTTEGYRRVAAPEAVHDSNSMFPHEHSVATRSSALSMTPQMLSAILRSSDASEFSVEDLTRLQAGISQQLSERARQASHHPAHVSRGVAPPESIGV